MVGKTGRQDGRLGHCFIVVGLEFNRILVDVFQQRMGGTRHAGFGVAHGRGPVAVHGAEIALPFDQRQAQGKLLRHADHGVINGLVAVGMVFAHDVTDDARRFPERLAGFVAAFLHRIEDSTVHRFQSVADIGKRARHDYAHRVIEVGRLHFVFDGDRGDVGIGGFRRAGIRGRRQKNILLFQALIGPAPGRPQAIAGTMKSSIFRTCKRPKERPKRGLFRAGFRTLPEPQKSPLKRPQAVLVFLAEIVFPGGNWMLTVVPLPTLLWISRLPP